MRCFDLRWLLIALPIAACSPESPSDHDVANQAPTVWLEAEPPTVSEGTYSIRFEWGGADPDGEISHFEFLITDNDGGLIDPAHLDGPWTSLFGEDSTFVFSTDPPRDESGGNQPAVTPSHTFFIRAVDDENTTSEMPYHRSFTGISLLPNVLITVPPAYLGLTPAAIPPISTFSWVHYGIEPDSVQWALVNTNAHNNNYPQTVAYLRSPASASEWSPWVWYPKWKSWTTPPQDLGNYVFAIRPKSITAMNPVLQEPLNVRRVSVVVRQSGPRFLVEEPLIGRIIASTCEHPLTIVDIAAHLSLAFTLSADAEAYGGTVVGYRYGWDILDPDDPSQWETDYLPFRAHTASTPPRSFSFGTHTFSAEAIDNLGQCSRIEIRINIVPMTGERNLLVIDDFAADEIPGQSGWETSNGAVPNDAEHDAFWLDMVSNVQGFDPATDVISTAGGALIPFATLAQYKAIVWSSFSDVSTLSPTTLPQLYQFIRYRSARVAKERATTCAPGTSSVVGNVTTNFVAQAMRSGVHTLIAGQHPVQNVMPRDGTVSSRRWPLIPIYELEPGSTQSGPDPDQIACRPGEFQFAYQDLCLEAIDFGYLPNQRGRVAGAAGPNRRYCPINGWRTPDGNSRRDDTMRGGVPLDPNFPTISLRAEAAGPGRFYDPASQGLDVEVYNPAYFREGAACAYVPAPRSCFEPIYGLGCLDTAELTYQQPVAFWASAFAHVIPEGVPGGVAARSVVFGFPPVYFNPSEIKPAIEHILFDEWQLPRAPVANAR